MNITTLKGIITRYLDGRASDKEKMLMDEWSSRALEDARSTDVTPVSETQRMAALAYLREATSDTTVTSAKVIWMRRLWKVAAACVVFAIGGATLYHYQFQLLDVIDPVPMQKVTAMKFEVKRVTLPDGSVVVLNAGSEISFPEKFRGHQRNVQLNGQAYFNITHNATAAFSIHAPHMQVQVLGTSFVMTDSSHIAAAKVAVKTGRISVTPGAEGASAMQLTADQAWSYQEEKELIQIADHQDVDIAWTNNKMVFNNNTLADVFQEIGRDFHVKITVADSTKMEAKFTGAFDTEDTLQGMLNVIALSYRLTIQKNKDGSIMVR